MLIWRWAKYKSLTFETITLFEPMGDYSIHGKGNQLYRTLRTFRVPGPLKYEWFTASLLFRSVFLSLHKSSFCRILFSSINILTPHWNEEKKINKLCLTYHNLSPLLSVEFWPMICFFQWNLNKVLLNWYLYPWDVDPQRICMTEEVDTH